MKKKEKKKEKKKTKQGKLESKNKKFSCLIFSFRYPKINPVYS